MDKGAWTVRVHITLHLWFDPPLDLMFWTFIEDFLWVFWHNVAFVINQIQHQPQSGSISNSLMPAHLLHKSRSLSNSTEAWEEATPAIRQSMLMAISFACFWDHGLFLASSPTNTESFGNCIRTSPDYFLGVSVVISKWHHYRSGGDRQITLVGRNSDMYVCFLCWSIIIDFLSKM
jgi:hypothetical protein